MVPKICTIEDCEYVGAVRRGMCNKHYIRLMRHGDPLHGEMLDTCSVHDCDLPRRTRGWCNTHYERWRRNGDPLKVLHIFGDESKRFWAYVDKAGNCWVWTGHKAADGYGRFRQGAGNPLAHRVSYEWANGAIPDEAEIDHMCHNRACVNPAHLRAATHKQNQENRAGASVTSTSGVRGVFRSGNKWEARVRHHGRTFHAGTFDSIPEAETAAITMRNKLFTHNVVDRKVS